MAFPFLDYGARRIAKRKSMLPAELALEEHQHLSFLTNIGLAVALFLGFVVIWVHVHSAAGGSAATAAYGAALGCGGVLGFLFGVPGSPKTPVTVNARAIAIGTGSKANATPPDDQAKAAANVDPTQATGTGVAGQVANLQQASDPAKANTSDAKQATDQTEPDASDPQQNNPPRLNTSNLEQVADWVTKLLLGGGLTQMQRIPPLVWRWSEIVAWGIIGDNPASPQRMQAERAFAAGLLVYGFLLGFFSGYLITKLQLGKAISE